MNPLFHSVRLRLQLWHALILLIVITVVCILTYRLAAGDRRIRSDRELERFERSFRRNIWDLPSETPRAERTLTFTEIRQRFASLRDGSRLPFEIRNLFDSNSQDAPYLIYWEEDGAILFQSANTPKSLIFPGTISPESDKISRQRGPYHELLRRSTRGSLSLVGRDNSMEINALHQLAWQITLGGSALWLLGLLGGWWLAGRAIQPIALISQTASRIADGNLTERINITNTDNELTRLSQVLNETFDRLANGIKHQREFTADASHELRTPLTIILSETSRGLKRDRPPHEYRDILSTCDLAARRMKSLVESLLILTRQDDSPLIPTQKIDLAPIAHDTLRLLQPLADAHKIRLIHKIQPTLCLADPAAIAVLLSNLISNAINHQPPGGTTTLRIFVENQTAKIEVTDNGPGIPPKHIPRLFNRFYRIDPARDPADGHSGLGLAIVKAICQNHQGRVTVESQIGVGTTFRVTLPA